MIRKLKESDILGLNNLPPADWTFDYESFLNNYGKDDFFHAFVMICNERIIGTGNVLLKGKIGWLANIIIVDDYRGKGLGFEMTKFLVEFLSEKGAETQLLIATDLGEKVYQKIGFKKISDYLRFESQVDFDYTQTNAIRPLKPSDLENTYKLDQEVNDENRQHIIDKYYKTGLGYFTENKELLGFYLPDFSRGLVLAWNKEVGIELLKLKHSKKGKRTMVPIENIDAINFFKSNGFKEGNKCSRMILGKENNWNPEFIYSYGSGYCG